MKSTAALRESYLNINDKAMGKFPEELAIQAKRPVQYMRTYALLLSESLDRLDEYIKSDPEDVNPEVEKIMEDPVRNNFKLLLEIAQNEKKAAVKDVWNPYTSKLKDIHASLYTLFSFFGTEKNYALTKKGSVLAKCAGAYIPVTPLDATSEDPDSALCDVVIDPSKAHDSFMFGIQSDKESVDATRWDRQQFAWGSSVRPPIVCPGCLSKRVLFRESLSKEQLAKLQKEKTPSPEMVTNMTNMKRTIDGYGNAITAIKTYSPLIERIKFAETSKKEEEEEEMEVDDAIANGDEDVEKEESENVVKRVDEDDVDDDATTDKAPEYDANAVPTTPGKGIFDDIREEEEEEEEAEEKQEKAPKTPTKQPGSAKSRSVPSSPAAQKTPTKSTETAKPKSQKKLEMDEDDDFQTPKSKEIKNSKPAVEEREEEDEENQEEEKSAMQVEKKQAVTKKSEDQKPSEPKQTKTKAKKETDEKPKQRAKKEKTTEESSQTTSKKRKRADDEENENGDEAEEKTKKPPAKKQKMAKPTAQKGKKSEAKDEEAKKESEIEETEEKPKPKKKPNPKTKQTTTADNTINTIAHVDSHQTREIANGFKIVEHAIFTHFSDPRLTDELKDQFNSMSTVARVFIKTLVFGTPEHQ